MENSLNSTVSKLFHLKREEEKSNLENYWFATRPYTYKENAINMVDIKILNLHGEPTNEILKKGTDFIIIYFYQEFDLVEIVYQKDKIWRLAYIDRNYNNMSNIFLSHAKEWTNKNEVIELYDDIDEDTIIGYVEPNQPATPLYRVNGFTYITYNYLSKSGFVKYDGEFDKF